MPNLENLRKQAKQYLRWHRQRYYPVAFLIRSTLPRYADLRDPQVLDAPFKLADAQELVARKMGYENWQALHSGIEAMDNQVSKSASSPSALSAEPMIFVADIKASCDFYSEKLGFAVAFIYGEPPFYGQVQRDGARLNLRCVAAPVIDPGLRDSEDLLSAAVTLDDAKPLFLEYQAAGVDFHQTLRTEPWGARTFIVRDPDGNLVLFAGSDGSPV
jgi:catechol 2,3-dioxygenase-like lactoylglutathione lyase family enzyme